jgi:hypothetical protein
MDRLLANQRIEAEVLVTLSEDFSKGLQGVEPTNIEIGGDMPTFDFGDLGSAYTDEDDYDDYSDGQYRFSDDSSE